MQYHYYFAILVASTGMITGISGVTIVLTQEYADCCV